MFAAGAGIFAAGIAAGIAVRIMEAARERQRQQQNRERDVLIRNLHDPLENFNELEFRRRFRVPKEMARRIIVRIEPTLPEEGVASRIPKRLQILLTLHFYASGSYQQSIADMKFFCVSQSTVSRIIGNVKTAITEESADEYIRLPETEEEFGVISAAFQNESHFLGIVGCIDCTHIRIQGPREEPWLFKNYKGYYSINIQVTCDHKMRITSIDGYPGLTHDASIWRRSQVKEIMEEVNRELAGTYFLLGDSGYPLSNVLITPIPDAEENTPEYRFTRRHTHIRCIIERVFGALKGRFRCLFNLRGLAYNLEKAMSFFTACSILHNWPIEYRMENGDDFDDDFDLNEEPFIYDAANDNGDGDNNDRQRERDRFIRGRRLRQEIIDNYFI